MGTLLIERIGVAAENRIGRADVEISHRRQIATRPGKEVAHDELVFAIGRNKRGSEDTAPRRPRT